jgi:hypothetical protein
VPHISLLRCETARTRVPAAYSLPMKQGLVRYQRAGSLHFVTFSCYGRRRRLASLAVNGLFETSMGKMRRKVWLFCSPTSQDRDVGHPALWNWIAAGDVS